VLEQYARAMRLACENWEKRELAKRLVPDGYIPKPKVMLEAIKDWAPFHKYLSWLHRNGRSMPVFFTDPEGRTRHEAAVRARQAAPVAEPSWSTREIRARIAEIQDAANLRAIELEEQQYIKAFGWRCL